ncbi:hypothetical protein LZ31DRAFT_467566 [Colletotrichum somersetense]|nr:hypothetical protein LZ31DRAFT_467566 [Colletotrichum somersetense]
MPTLTKNAIIKDEEWMRVQPIIRKLYLLEDKSLKDVIVILSTIHNFRPTLGGCSKGQLESKLKQWHMTKNMTSLEWKYVDARIRRRRLQGKESKVYLSGIPLRPATVEKARTRHSFESTLDKIAGKAPPSPKDLSLIIRTPSPPAEEPTWERSLSPSAVVAYCDSQSTSYFPSLSVTVLSFPTTQANFNTQFKRLR